MSRTRTMSTPTLRRRITEESGRLEEQQQDDEHEAQEERRFGAEGRGDDGVDEPQHESPEDGSRDTAQAPKDDNDERLEQRLFSHHRIEQIGRASCRERV